MGFLDEVRDALRRPPGLADTSEVPEALVERCRRVVFDELSTMPPGRALEQAFHRFAEREDLVARVGAAWRSAASGPFGPASASDRAELVVEALRQHLRGGSDAPGTFRERELRRLSERFDEQRVGWRDPVRYLVEIGALDGRLARTRLGELLLRLGVRELTVALLHAEALQSTGNDDGRRLPRWVFVALARRVSLSGTEFPPWPDLRRLVALGLLEFDVEYSELECVPDRLPWLADAADEQSPLGLLVRSALEDDAQLSVAPHGAAPGSERAVRGLAELVSHELGNSLGPLDLTLQQLAQDLPANHRHLTRLRDLADRLQTFARSIAHMAPGAEPVTEIELLDLLQDVLARTAPERNGHLVVALEVRETRFTGRRARLRLALENLVRNAAQAAHGAQRSMTLTIRGGAVTDGLSVVVEDDGPGVPPAIVGLLFERGTSGRGGTGLGLSLVREVLAEHRGTVRYEPVERGGARFVLHWPGE